MASISQLEKEIAELKQRNKRVELDKQWETSRERKAIIAILTYFVIVIFMWSVGISNPFTNAIVPTIGFVLSTLSLSFFKDQWKRSFRRG